MTHSPDVRITDVNAMRQIFQCCLLLFALPAASYADDQPIASTPLSVSAQQTEPRPLVSDSETPVTFSLTVTAACEDPQHGIALDAFIADSQARLSSDTPQLDAILSITVPADQLRGLQMATLCQRESKRLETPLERFRLHDAFSMQLVTRCLLDGAEQRRRYASASLDIDINCPAENEASAPES